MVQLDKAPKPAVDMGARRRKNGRIIVGFAIPIAFVFGIALGGAGDDATATTAAPTPTPTVTVTAEAAPAPTVTADPVVDIRVPDVCIVALDTAERITSTMSGAMQAAGRLDVEAVEAVDVDELEDDVAEYNAASSICRDA